MLADAEHAIILIVVPKNVDEIPLMDVYEAARNRKWAFAIVEASCAATFQERYGDLPWDQVWTVDLNDDMALEKALAEAQAKAKEPRPLPPPAATRPWPSPFPEPTPEPRHRKRLSKPTWKRKKMRINWYDEPVKDLRKRIRGMVSELP